MYSQEQGVCRAVDTSVELPAQVKRDQRTSTTLPYVDTPEDAWTRIYVFSRCSAPRQAECAAALELSEIWWHSVREHAQRIFIETEAPGEDAIREWTIERRHFFERWLATPTPVLSMESGVFRLSHDIGVVFEDWARCADDTEATDRWRARSAR